MIETFFLLGAYALYQKEYDVIKQLWEANQPSDTKAHWVGHDIVPNSLAGLISVVFSKDNYAREFALVWDGHHGAANYFDEYFILCLARLIANSKASVNPTKLDANTGSISTKALKVFVQSVDDILAACERLKKNDDVLRTLGLDSAERRKLFDSELPNLLTSLKGQYAQEINSRLFRMALDPNRVTLFKESCTKEFFETAIIRAIFANNQKIVDRTELHSGNTTNKTAKAIKLSHSDVFLKELFISGKLEKVGDAGATEGISHARTHNEFLIHQFLASVTACSMDSFEKQQLKGRNLFAITSNTTIEFHSSLNIVKETAESSEIDGPKLKPWGHLACANETIPVFVLREHLLDEKMLVIDVRDAGWFIQYGLPSRDATKTEDELTFDPEILDFETSHGLLEKVEAEYKTAGSIMDRDTLRKHVLFRTEQLFRYLPRKNVDRLVD